MSYKIAVGSSDGENIDLKFGEVKEFLIYEVNDGKYTLSERREVIDEKEENKENSECNAEKSGCSDGGCNGGGHGCSGPSDVVHKVELINDCRCVVCKKVGFQAQKQFERKTISVFDIEIGISEALDKITAYYNKLDKK